MGKMNYDKNLQMVAMKAREKENLDQFYLSLMELKQDVGGNIALQSIDEQVASLDDYINQTKQLLNEAEREIGDNEKRRVNKTNAWGKYNKFYTSDKSIRRFVAHLVVNNNSDVVIKSK